MQFELTAPTRVTFLISVVLVVVALVIHFANIKLAIFPTHGFAMLLLGYLVLLAGNVLSGV
jgi:hypothetical protein